jgi:hypothetical protein
MTKSKKQNSLFSFLFSFLSLVRVIELHSFFSLLEVTYNHVLSRSLSILGYTLWGKPEEAVRLLAASGAAICRSVAEDLPSRTAQTELVSAVAAASHVEEDVEAALQVKWSQILGKNYFLGFS